MLKGRELFYALILILQLHQQPLIYIAKIKVKQRFLAHNLSFRKSRSFSPPLTHKKKEPKKLWCFWVSKDGKRIIKRAKKKKGKTCEQSGDEDALFPGVWWRWIWRRRRRGRVYLIRVFVIWSHLFIWTLTTGRMSRKLGRLTVVRGGDNSAKMSCWRYKMGCWKAYLIWAISCSFR